MGNEYYLHPHGRRLVISGRGHRLILQPGDRLVDDSATGLFSAAFRNVLFARKIGY